MTTIGEPTKPLDGAQYLYNKYIAGNPERELMFCEAGANSEIASALYDMREAAGLTQQELAEMIGTKKSAISRIEDGDYKGHSLGMLRRVAEVLGYKVSVNFEKVTSANEATKRPRPAATKAVAKTAAEPVKEKAGKQPVLAKRL